MTTNLEYSEYFSRFYLFKKLFFYQLRNENNLYFTSLFLSLSRSDRAYSHQRRIEDRSKERVSSYQVFGTVIPPLYCPGLTSLVSGDIALPTVQTKLAGQIIMTNHPIPPHKMCIKSLDFWTHHISPDFCIYVIPTMKLTQAFL